MVPKWPWFLVEVAVKASGDLATLRGWVRHMFGRRSGMLCVLSLIYILWPLLLVHTILKDPIFGPESQRCSLKKSRILRSLKA